MSGRVLPFPSDERDPFGRCPVCRRTDGYLNIGPSHWGYCLRHLAKWPIGRNVFSSWRFETPADWTRNHLRLARCRAVEAYVPAPSARSAS